MEIYVNIILIICNDHAECIGSIYYLAFRAGACCSLVSLGLTFCPGKLLIGIMPSFRRFNVCLLTMRLGLNTLTCIICLRLLNLWTSL